MQRLGGFLTKAIPAYNAGEEEGLDNWLFRLQCPMGSLGRSSSRMFSRRTRSRPLHRPMEELTLQMSLAEQEATFTVNSGMGFSTSGADEEGPR